MSVELIVFLRREKLPTRDAWQQAISASEYDLRLDNADTASHTGFWPVKLGEVDCGFEYFFGRVVRDEEPEEVLAAVGGRDHRATFVLDSSLDEYRAASVAAGVLTKISDGVLLDPQSGEIAEGASAIELFKEQERAEQERKMQQAEKKWGSITQRRCPQCNSPCPEYRPTCFVCGHHVGRVQASSS